MAFRGRPADPDWLPPDEVAALLAAQASGNVSLEQAQDDLRRAVAQLDDLRSALAEQAGDVAERLRESHTRVRAATRQSGVSKIDVRAHTPVDVLGVYLYLPVPGDTR